MEQCLGDIVEFINDITSGVRQPARTILYGSGFGATLAAWTRKKYPHLVHGVLASSGIFDLEVSTYSKTINKLSYS